MSNLRRSHDQEWLNGVLIGAVFGFAVASFVAPEGSATGSAMAGLTVAFMCLAVAQGEVTRPRPRPGT
jgi:gas vesicle protein